MKEAVIVSGARTAVGEFGGSLKGVKTADMGALVIKEALKRAGLRPSVNDLLRSFRPAALGNFEMTEINKKYYDYKESLKIGLHRRSDHGQRITGRARPKCSTAVVDLCRHSGRNQCLYRE